MRLWSREKQMLHIVVSVNELPQIHIIATVSFENEFVAFLLLRPTIFIFVPFRESHHNNRGYEKLLFYFNFGASL